MLEVTGLRMRAGGTTLLDAVTFRVEAGERVALIGPSGSGKSLTASAVVGHVPPDLDASGSVRIDGRDVLNVPVGIRPAEARPAMIFQDSSVALNPLVTIRGHLHRVLLAHGTAPSDLDRRARELLVRVAFEDPDRILASVPTTLSGGQRQRACIAVAVACRRSLLVADEPTTALDMVGQARVLSTLRTVTAAPTSLLFVTHDIAVAATLCSRIIVMDRGRIVEDGAVADVLARPRTALAASLVRRARASQNIVRRAVAGAA